MTRSSTIRFWFYIALAVAGLVTAWVFNGLAVMNREDYGTAWTGSAVDMVLTADLSIVAIASVVFMISEARRVGVKRVWLYIVLSGFTAMAFTFPLFLAMRERRIGLIASGTEHSI